jgi:hypothetical protein
MRVCFGLAIAAILGMAGVLRAEPLDLKQVPADAKWGAHLDADAARASTVVNHAIDFWLEKHPGIKENMDKVHEAWKINPRENLHAITIYGRTMKPGEGVAIVHATVDQAFLLEKVKQAPGYEATTYGKYELHSWTHGHQSPHERPMNGTFYKPDVIVFAHSIDDLKAALDVLDGTKPNMSEHNPFGEIPQGAILVAGATNIADAKLPPQMHAAKQIDSAHLIAGEYQGETFMNAKMMMKTAEAAQQMKAFLDGLRAMAAMQHGDEPEALKAINAITVTVNDKSVELQAKMPADAVWGCMKKHMENMPAHGFGPHGEHHGEKHP